MEEVENNPQIHKFWNIPLIEHELNFLLSLIWAQRLPHFLKKEKYYMNLKKVAESEDMQTKCCTIRYFYMICVKS